MKATRNIITAISLLLTTLAVAQGNIKTAINDFNAGRYDEAIANLEQLVATNDRDVKANYYLGAAYVRKNVNLSEGIKRLKFAQVKGTVLDSYFYLGRAYQLIFEFEQAQVSLQKFLQTSKDEALTLEAQILLEECTNSIPLASKLFNVRVIDKFRVSYDSLLTVYNPSREVGSVIHNRDFFESDIDPDGVLYRTERGDAVYFSLPNGAGKEKLYKIERLLDGWGEMVALEGLASEGNDCMPVMMTDGTTLYFSSDREGGMGGFDIYRTTYDNETRTFTQPINLGVPFNSAFDDFLFVGDEFRNKAWFTSNRETRGDSLVVYEILWDESVIRNYAQSTDDIRRASSLPIDPSLKRMRDDQTTAGGKTRAEHSISRETKKFEFVVNDSLTYTQWEHFRSDAARSEYTKALEKQQLRDSLSADMNSKRKEFMQLTDNELRNQKIAEILQIERKTYALDDELKDDYASVRRKENARLTELIQSGDYQSLSSIEPPRRRLPPFDWNELLIPSNFEMYTPLIFQDEKRKNASLYASLFSLSEQKELAETDSLYAWASVLKLEAAKVIDHANNNEHITLRDAEGVRTTMKGNDLISRAEMLRQASATLFNKALDARFDIFDDRYAALIDAEPDIDFSQTDELRQSAIHDFASVEGITLSNGAERFEQAATVKRRGMEHMTEAMNRYRDHADGSFPLPRKGRRSEPESVVVGLQEQPTEEPETAVAEPETVVAEQETAAEEQVAEKPVYKIQLGAFRNQPNEAKLSVFQDITTLELPQQGLTKYFSGLYSTYAEAQQNIERARSEFAGAFIVAFLGQTQIKLSEAQKLE